MTKFAVCKKTYIKTKKNSYIYCKSEEIHSKSFPYELLTCTSEKRISPSVQDNWTRLKETSRVSLVKSKFMFWQSDSILRKKRTADYEPPKRSSEKIEQVQTFLHRAQWHRWEKQHPSRCFTILFRVMKFDLKHNFFSSCQISPAIDWRPQTAKNLVWPLSPGTTRSRDTYDEWDLNRWKIFLF